MMNRNVPSATVKFRHFVQSVPSFGPSSYGSNPVCKKIFFPFLVSCIFFMLSRYQVVIQSLAAVTSTGVSRDIVKGGGGDLGIQTEREIDNL